MCCGRAPALHSRPLSRTPWVCIHSWLVKRQTCNSISGGGSRVPGTGPCQPGGSCGIAGSHRLFSIPPWRSNRADSGSSLPTPSPPTAGSGATRTGSAAGQKLLWRREGTPPKTSRRAQANQARELSLQSHAPVLPHLHLPLSALFLSEHMGWDFTKAARFPFSFFSGFINLYSRLSNHLGFKYLRLEKKRFDYGLFQKN